MVGSDGQINRGSVRGGDPLESGLAQGVRIGRVGREADFRCGARRGPLLAVVNADLCRTTGADTGIPNPTDGKPNDNCETTRHRQIISSSDAYRKQTSCIV
jgi:hypothetical protein